MDLRTIVPLDTETVYESVAKTGRLLTVHESQANCGIGSELVARIYEEAPHLLKAPARRLGMAPVSLPVSQTLEEEVLPWKTNIKAAVLEMLDMIASRLRRRWPTIPACVTASRGCRCASKYSEEELWQQK